MFSRLAVSIEPSASEEDARNVRRSVITALFNLQRESSFISLRVSLLGIHQAYSIHQGWYLAVGREAYKGGL